ncbi:MAG TPA: hypothetical protein VFX89_17700 [Gammaproteobacteria bacterium]|nr:hypothetical protein [Gammaproteobacteria bacterium]
MLIRFTRLTNDRHRFEIVRDDGTREARELETRSALEHDLAHYAVELEAGLSESFYGRLAQGITYDELTTVPMISGEALQTEGVVVRFQDSPEFGSDPERCVREIVSGFAAMGREPPTWVTADFVARARERLRRVRGLWRATPFHRTMELEFPKRAGASIAP